MKKILKILLPIAAVIFGIVFVVVGITTLSNKDKYDTTVTATVVEVEEQFIPGNADEADRTEYTAYIDYEVNGKKFEHVLSPIADEGLSEGDTVEILCQSEDPAQISAPNITSGGIAFIVVGVLVAIGGIITTIKNFIRR